MTPFINLASLLDLGRDYILARSVNSLITLAQILSYSIPDSSFPYALILAVANFSSVKI